MFVKLGFTVALLVLGLFSVTDAQIPIGQCNKIDSCSCVYDDGTIVNLRPLTKTDGTPGFNNITSGVRKDRYFWNPCTPFSLPGNNSCQNAAVCMIRQAIPNAVTYDIGDQDSAQFKVDENGTLKLTYTADKGDFLRIAEISLICQSKAIFDFLTIGGEQPENNNTVLYTLTLKSQSACAKAPRVNPAQKSSSSLSGGTIFLIVLLSLIGAYIVFGVMFQLFVKKESGRKLCPNHEFWFGLPELIKGGCSTVTMRKPDSGKYDSI